MEEALQRVLGTVAAVCAAEDVQTYRGWNESGGVACVTRPWRTSDWIYTDECACAIPRLALFNGPRALNVESILRTTRLERHLHLQDRECLQLLAELEREWRDVNLTGSFVGYADGRIRSDMCRLAMLWRHGGFYFDDDLVPLVDVTQHLHPAADFVSGTTVRMFGNRPGILNAFIASIPRHPILRTGLYEHARWFDMSPKERVRRVGTMPKPNIGTVLLRDAVRRHVGDDALFETERTGAILGGVQLYREIPLIHEDSYRTRNLCVLCVAEHQCNFAIADVLTGEVLFKMRKAQGVECPVFCGDQTCIIQSGKLWRHQ